MIRLCIGTANRLAADAHLEADRQVASTLAELIIGRALASFEITGTAREAGERGKLTYSRLAGDLAGWHGGRL